MVDTAGGFRGEYRFLSNFWVAPVTATVRGLTRTFATSEHLYQAYKLECSPITQDEAAEWVDAFMSDSAPGAGKSLGRNIPLNAALWDEAAVHYMRLTLYLKFTQNPELLTKLVDTADVELIEYNGWGDTTWGVDTRTGEGKNRLGKLLMELRELVSPPATDSLF